MKLLLAAISCSFLTATLPAFSATTVCSTDGRTDVSVCLAAGLTAAKQHHDSQFYLPAGTYLISSTLVVPDRIEMIGAGLGSVIKASPTFPLNGTLVEMGVVNNINYGVQVKHFTLDGGYRAAIGLENLNSMEQSYGEDLLIQNFLAVGLHVEGSAAQNSGPFRHLMIAPGSGATVINDTGCVLVSNVIAFRGLSNVTCDGGTEYASRPSVAFRLDGQGTYMGLRVANYATAVNLGSGGASADGMVILSSSFGPNVDTGIVIDPQTHSQNLSLFGVSCTGCQQVLDDTITGRSSSRTIGWYLLGNGAGSDKKVLSSDPSIVDTLGTVKNW